MNLAPVTAPAASVPAAPGRLTTHDLAAAAVPLLTDAIAQLQPHGTTNVPAMESVQVAERDTEAARRFINASLTAGTFRFDEISRSLADATAAVANLSAVRALPDPYRSPETSHLLQEARDLITSSVSVVRTI